MTLTDLSGLMQTQDVRDNRTENAQGERSVLHVLDFTPGGHSGVLIKFFRPAQCTSKSSATGNATNGSLWSHWI